MLTVDKKQLRRTTIKDVAARLRISHSTVSRALHGDPHISAATKELVRDAAERLGYVANNSARLIREDRGTLIGFVVPDIQNHFYSTIAKVLAQRCRSSSFQMVLANTDDDPATENDEVRALIEARAAGIVITPSVAPREKTIALLRSVPTVQLVRHVTAIPGGLVCTDDASATRAAATHLLSLGHRNIGYVGPRKDMSAGQTRLAGFLNAHRRAGVEPDKAAIVLVPPRQTFGFEAISRLLSLPKVVTAVLIGSSELTLGGLHAVREAGLSIPRDLSVVGYGDPFWFQLFSPPLTAVRLPVEDLAEATALQLFSRIRALYGEEENGSDGNGNLGQLQLRLPASLIIRHSTSAPKHAPRPSRQRG